MSFDSEEEIRGYIRRVIEHDTLTQGESFKLMGHIIRGEITDGQLAALMAAYEMRVITGSELAGFAHAVRGRSGRIAPETTSPIADICGTGGDYLRTFNVSTAAAIVAAAAGVVVAKHGNHGVTSSCGSADVLRLLGVNIYGDEAVIKRCLNEVGLAFIYAPHVHPWMGRVSKVRQEVRFRSFFNVLGPLVNPVKTTCQVIGVYKKSLIRPMMDALSILGENQSVVLCGFEGMDEFSLVSGTYVGYTSEKLIQPVSPEKFDLFSVSLTDLRVITMPESAEMIQRVLNGRPGGARDTVVVNAALVLLVSGTCKTITEGVHLVKEAIDSGSSLRKLKDIIRVSGGRP
jgi:anthranilate phosphoribosyltransferase